MCLNKNKYKYKNRKGYGYNYPLVIMISLVSLVAIGFYSIGYMKYLKKIGQDSYSTEINQDDVKKANNADNKNNSSLNGLVRDNLQDDINNGYNSYASNSNNLSIDVSTNDIKIQDLTVCRNIIVNLATNERDEELSKVPEYFVGLTRELLSKYYDNYMQNMPEDEVASGLQTINILSFSQDEVTIEKIYDKTSVKYYIVDEDGYIKVYYGDKKTLYENTGIETRDLPDNEKNNLKAGIWIDNEEELLSVLESYSS